MNFTADKQIKAEPKGKVVNMRSDVIFTTTNGPVMSRQQKENCHLSQSFNICLKLSKTGTIHETWRINPQLD